MGRAGKTRQSGVTSREGEPRAAAPERPPLAGRPSRSGVQGSLTRSLRVRKPQSLRFSLRLVKAAIKLLRTSLSPTRLQGKSKLQDREAGGAVRQEQGQRWPTGDRFGERARPSHPLSPGPLVRNSPRWGSGLASQRSRVPREAWAPLRQAASLDTKSPCQLASWSSVVKALSGLTRASLRGSENPQGSWQMLAAESSCKNPLPHAEGSAHKAGHRAPSRLPEHFLSSSVKTLLERALLGLRMGPSALGSVAQASSWD